MTDASPPTLTREEWAALLTLADTSPGRAWPEKPAESRALFSAAFALEARGLVERIEDNDVQYVPTHEGILALKRLGISTARIEAMAGRLRVERADARALNAARKVAEGLQPAAPGYADQVRAWITAWGTFGPDLPRERDAELTGGPDDAFILHARRANRRNYHTTLLRRVWATLDDLDRCQAAEAAASKAESDAGREGAVRGRSWTLAEALGSAINTRGRNVPAMRALGEILGLDVDAELGPAVEGIRAELDERDTLAAQADLSLAQRDEARRERGVAEAERDAALTREAKALLDREAHRRVALDMGRERDRAVAALADERAEVARLRAELTRIEDERRAEQAERA